MIKLDVQTLAAILGFLGLVVTTLGGVYVATRNRETEKEDSAQKALEATRDEAYEQRLTLRDETIASLEKRLEQLKIDKNLEIEELEAELDSKILEIKQLKGV